MNDTFFYRLFTSRRAQEDKITQLQLDGESLAKDRDRLRDDNVRLQTQLDTELRVKKNELADLTQRAKNQVAELEQKHRHADEDVRHLVKIKESAMDIAFEKRCLENDKAKQTAIDEARDEYRDKLEENLEKQIEDIKQMYSQIVTLLPNVNMDIKRSTKTTERKIT